MSRRLIEEVKSAGAELGSNAAAQRAVEAVTGAIDRITGAGERVTIRGFGTFKVVQRNERMARNPKTGEPVKVAARKRLTFNSTK
jgi:DNA-binding protein HU-beta